MNRDYHSNHSYLDWPLFICVAIIALLGVLNLYSATSVYSGIRSELYISQIYWLVVGGIIGGIIIALDYKYLERWGYIFYAFGIFTLVVVLALARDVRGSSRWIELGAFRFQPSEFMKIFLVIALAKYLHNDSRIDERTLKDLTVPAIITFVPAIFIIRQPDLGTATILVLIFLMIASLTKIRLKSIIILLGFVAISAPVVWNYILLPYQRERINTFLNPESDILHHGWHAFHSRVAIGNGGLWGNGFLKGTQNQFLFLPDQYSDFPFPVFAEEWGFVGSLVLIFLYCLLVLLSIRVASQARDRFGAVLAVGSATIIFWHAWINIGMTTGMLPVVGVPLPLFSHGGSSVTTVLISIACIISVSIRKTLNPSERSF